MVKILKSYLTPKKSYDTLFKGANFFGQPCIKTKCPLSLADYKKIRNRVTHDKEVVKKAFFEN